jgi:hypothetical protein
MSLVSTLLALAADLALGVWLGAMVFFSFVAAPTVFSVLPEADAGTVVNAVFPKYYVFGAVLGIVALAAGAGRGAVTGFATPLLALLGATLVGVVLFAYSRWVLVPRMEAAGDDAFERYHRQSVILNGLAMLAVVAALTASHL